MHFAAFTFLAMPRGLLLTLLAFSLQLSAFSFPAREGRALATDGQRTCAAVASVLPCVGTPREGQLNCRTSVMFVRLGVISAGGVRGSAAGHPEEFRA
jgi:hypothetical protein